MSQNLNLANSEWVPLVKNGLYRHQLGVQKIDDSTCAKLVENFKVSFLDKVLKRFCPLFEGHPEGDAQAVGYVRELKYMKPYLMAKLDFLPQGLELISAGLNKLSPVWECESSEDGFCYPEKLISVGLVQNPNIKIRTVLGNSDFDLYWFGTAKTSDLIPKWRAQGKDIEAEIARKCTLES